MFKSLKNIETAFQLVRTAMIVAVVGSFSLVGYIKYSSDCMVAREREKIYVLDEGKSLMLALSQDMSENRPSEAKHHVKMFHELFFSLSPDNDAINYNIQRALYLADKSAFSYFNDLKEMGYYRKIIANNILQRVQVDSMQCDFNVYPYRVMLHAQQIITRSSNITHRSLVTICLLENAVRSDNNPHGFLITNFIVTENNELSREKR